MKRIVLIGLLVASSAFAAKPPDAVRAEKSVVEAAKRLVTDTLNDPESARFRDVFVSAKEGVVCGEVNSKNGYGGYIGFQKFMIEDGRIFFANDGPSFPGLIEMACRR